MRLLFCLILTVAIFGSYAGCDEQSETASSLPLDIHEVIDLIVKQYLDNPEDRDNVRMVREVYPEYIKGLEREGDWHRAKLAAQKAASLSELWRDEEIFGLRVKAIIFDRRAQIWDHAKLLVVSIIFVLSLAVALYKKNFIGSFILSVWLGVALLIFCFLAWNVSWPWPYLLVVPLSWPLGFVAFCRLLGAPTITDDRLRRSLVQEGGTCPKCKGRGKVDSDTCWVCRGLGGVYYIDISGDE